MPKEWENLLSKFALVLRGLGLKSYPFYFRM